MNTTAITRLWASTLPLFDKRSDVTLQDRYKGVMLGVAAGNLLGLRGEGTWKESLRRRFPGGLTDIDPAEAHRPWDDDLAQTGVLAEALLATNRLSLDDLAERFLKWGRENGRGMGHLTRVVLWEMDKGRSPAEAAKYAWDNFGDTVSGKPAGNGAVMRCTPVALKWRRNPHLLVEETMRSAAITHYDPRCQWSAVAVNVALATTLEGRYIDLSTLASALGEAGAPESVCDAIQAVEAGTLEDFDLDAIGTKGFTLKAMQAGLWCLTRNENFEQALIAVVNEAGDTDTNGAVAGAILGGMHGDSTIPPRWLACVPARERLGELAEKLLSASEKLA
jgi:ADP-ribosyl-[dinitrogen reductase] hydrolase